MTANRGLFVRNLGTVGTTPIEGRLVMASLVAENSPGVPRNGLLDQRATTVVSGTASMTYSVAACNIVVNRAAGEGVYMFNLTGTTTVATTNAPGSGSRWDLIYVKQNDPDKGDANNTAVLAVLQGTSSTGTPTKPYASLPAGAYVLAEAQVSSGATATNGAQVAISQVWRYTALRGAPIPVRNTTERAEITPGSLAVGVTVRRLDVSMPNLDAIERWTGSAWAVPWAYAEFNNNGFAVAGGLVNWDVGALTQDNSKTWNNTFASSAGALSGAINILESGLYSVTFMTSPSGTPGRAGLILKNGSSQTYASSFTDGAVWEMTATFTRYLTAGTYIRGVLIQNNSTTNATTATILKHTGTWT
ncbi:minor tail protein [Arthrobacter phage Wildwest]|uniref:Minor tail protein n=1 Tax=Arthrobacter phage Wildwest TaxID=3051767 RepID=A0AA96KHT5_9CAUD|nr:minor tail protein [Arthrobacter phage Wildwest]